MAGVFACALLLMPLIRKPQRSRQPAIDRRKICRTTPARSTRAVEQGDGREPTMIPANSETKPCFPAAARAYWFQPRHDRDRRRLELAGAVPIMTG